MAMWVHVMRLVPEEGITARDLARRSQIDPKAMRQLVQRLGKWWGYLDVGDGIRPSEAGRKAQGIWAPLTDEIDARWRDRFGSNAVDELREALANIEAHLEIEYPDFLGSEPRLIARKPLIPRKPAEAEGPLPLTVLLSRVLQALAIDFDQHSDLSLGVYTAGAGSRLGICANVLRLIDGDGVAVAELPARSGVGQMSIDNWIGALSKLGYLDVATETAGRRRRMARLTEQGERARGAYLTWTASLDGRWPRADASGALGRAAAAIVGEPGPGSPLWQGMEPYPDGWRSQIPPRQALPHFPAVSHRGGFPDGT